MDKIINLLPEQEKEEVEQEKKIKKLFCLAIFPLLFLIIFSGTLYLIKYFGPNFFEKDTVFYFQEIEKLEDVSEKKNKIDQFNSLVYGINSFYQKERSVLYYLKEINQIIPPNARYKEIQFNKKGTDFEFVLSGTSKDWETIFKIEEIFKEKEQFKNLNFSPQNWTKEEDIDFLISFIVKDE